MSSWLCTKHRFHALGTVDLSRFTFHNQRITRLKLLRLVDLTSYRTSTGPSAFATGDRGDKIGRIIEITRATEPSQVAVVSYSFDYSGSIGIEIAGRIRFILLRERSESNRRSPVQSAGDRDLSQIAIRASAAVISKATVRLWSDPEDLLDIMHLTENVTLGQPPD